MATKEDLPDLFYCGNIRPTKEEFNPIENTISNKPNGGLWTSPLLEDGDMTEWEHFVTNPNNEMPTSKYTERFHIVPTDDCRILIADEKISNLKEYIANPKDPIKLQKLDWEKISKDYDVVYFPEVLIAPQLQAFDVASAIFMDKNKFTVLDEREYIELKRKEELEKERQEQERERQLVEEAEKRLLAYKNDEALLKPKQQEYYKAIDVLKCIKDIRSDYECLFDKTPSFRPYTLKDVILHRKNEPVILTKDEEASFSKEVIEELLIKKINGDSSAHLDYPKYKKLPLLFGRKKEQKRRQEINLKVDAFNDKINKLTLYQKKETLELLKQYYGKLLEDSSLENASHKYEEAKKSLSEEEEKLKATYINYLPNQMLEDKALVERFKTKAQIIEKDTPTTLKTSSSSKDRFSDTAPQRYSSR